MKAIILAAGRGSRMKSLTDEKPKCLIELNGKPLLEWQLEALRGAGIEDIAIVTGYKKELLHRYGLKEFHNSLWAETQMVSSLMCANEWLQQSECVVSYSDIFYESSAINLLKGFREDLCITYDPNWAELWRRRFDEPLDDAETFCLDESGQLLDIGGKAQSIQEIQGQYMGLLKYSPCGWSVFRNEWLKLSGQEQSMIHMTGMLRRIIAAGDIKISPIVYMGRWGEFDSIADLKCGFFNN